MLKNVLFYAFFEFLEENEYRFIDKTYFFCKEGELYVLQYSI